MTHEALSSEEIRALTRRLATAVSDVFVQVEEQADQTPADELIGHVLDGAFEAWPPLIENCPG